MAAYIWAIGFDWNETRTSRDPDRKVATMQMSLGDTVLEHGKHGYPIDVAKSDVLDLRLFDRTNWENGQVPPPSAFLFRAFRIDFERAADAPAQQSARSPISTSSLQTDQVGSYLSQGETTPCFPNEVSGHTWDFGDSSIVHGGRFELTISFEVSIDEKPFRWFQKDPEMVVTGVSG